MAQPRKAERNQEILARYRAGESARSIAAAYEVSHQRVYSILERFRAENPGKSLRPRVGACEHCGEWFPLPRTGPGRRRRYCSVKCRRAASAAQHEAAPGAESTPDQALVVATPTRLVMSSEEPDGGRWLIVYERPPPLGDHPESDSPAP